VRLRYEEWLARFIERLREDAALVAAFDRVKERALTDPALLAYVETLWTDIKGMLRADLADERSAIAQHIEQALADVGARLAADAGLRESLNEHLLSASAQLATTLREGVTQHIAQTVKDWDDRRLVDQLELSVGRDLQYIRINGALVGGLAGLALHAARVLMP
jgi:uncharacterized membrane-anchored protein YjiN (DUF445 family)